MMRQIHALTPGDHYSPATGSAIATVVHGLATHTVPRPAVLVAEGTYSDRYSSADPIEYAMHHAPHGMPRRTKALDAALGRAALPRPWSRRVHRQVLVSQDTWDPSYVICHNAPQLVPLVSDRHTPVLYVHNNLLDWYSGREASRALHSAYRIVCVSHYTAEQTKKKLNASLGKRVRVVPNGVDVSQFNMPRSPRGDALRVGFIGRVIPQKGVHILLQAVAMLNRRDVELTIVGSSGFDSNDPLTKYEVDLRTAASKIPGPVTFVPFQRRSEVPRLLSTFDVAVVPSIAPEAYPLAVLEGMASGCAVIASDLGGIPEAANGAAYLVQPGDVSAMAEAIEALADAPAAIRSLVERGRVRAQSMSWERAANRLVQALH